MECRDDMTEVIADARAEEEVMKEQLRKRIQEAGEEAKARIKERLKAVQPMVTISMDEYTALKDAERVVNTLWNNLRRASYDPNVLRVSNEDELMIALKLFYPEKYAEKLKELNEELNEDD